MELGRNSNYSVGVGPGASSHLQGISRSFALESAFAAGFAGAILGEGRPLASSEETRQALLAGAVWCVFLFCFVGFFFENGEGVEGKERSLLNVQKLKARLHVHIFTSLKLSERNTLRLFLQDEERFSLMKNKVIVKGILESGLPSFSRRQLQ